jgi:hypothetical protein
MKIVFFLLFVTLIATAQTKKIDFFGTEFYAKNNCEYKAVQVNRLQHEKNALVWADAPPKFVLDMLLSTFKTKIEEKKVQEIKTQDIKIKLLKTIWIGKFSQYKKEKNDTITSFVQLFANYKSIDRMLILTYKTTKQEKFRIPACFDFLAK